MKLNYIFQTAFNFSVAIALMVFGHTPDFAFAKGETGCPVEIEAPGPVDFFTFASDSRGEGRAISTPPIHPQSIVELARRFQGNVIVGGDPSDGRDKKDPDPTSEGWIFLENMAAAKTAGLKRHVYLEGPKGPTGSNGFQSDEWLRLVNAAKKYGIDANTKEGMEQWNTSGWKEFTNEQILHYDRQGFETFEIDNLGRAIGIGESSEGLIAYLKEFSEWKKLHKVKMKLVLKNQSETNLIDIAAEVLSKNPGHLDRALFADFAISERSEDNPSDQEQKEQEETWKNQIAAGKLMGIQVLPSKNTYDYDATGEYQVEECKSKR